LPVATPNLEVRDLKKHFPARGGVFGRRLGAVHTVDGVSFVVRAGESLGIVGESGCGKSTTARMIVKLIESSSRTLFGAQSAHVRGRDRPDQSVRRRARPVPLLPHEWGYGRD
jgi:ABC-type oligopeptide transport system ATPase subunit